MNTLRLALLSYLAIALLFLAPKVYASDLTNTCVRDLGLIQVCQDRGPLGFPKDLQACCDGVRALAQDSCHCNPAIDNILGEEGKQIYQLEAVCRIAQPTKWGSITPVFLKKCEATKTHEYGCEKTDVEVDGERIKSILSFQEGFKNTLDEKACFDTPSFANRLKTVFTPDVKVVVPYGVGVYEGTESAAEYLGMAFSGLTHGYWRHDMTLQPTKKARLEVSSDGKTWTTGSTFRGSYLRGAISYDSNYFEQEIKFEGCEAKANRYTVLASDGMHDLAQNIVQTSDLSKRWSIEDICRYHTKFCANDPGTRQYESEQACIDYLDKLPLYTQACGANRALSGHSISCKFKHHFMIPANPKMHCAHIGMKGVHDMNDHLKCDDEAECSNDDGQDLWPAINQVGDQTPANIRAIFEKSNANFKDEPFGCAVPAEEGATQGHDHH